MFAFTTTELSGRKPEQSEGGGGGKDSDADADADRCQVSLLQNSAILDKATLQIIRTLR